MWYENTVNTLTLSYLQPSLAYACYPTHRICSLRESNLYLIGVNLRKYPSKITQCGPKPNRYFPHPSEVTPFNSLSSFFLALTSMLISMYINSYFLTNLCQTQNWKSLISFMIGKYTSHPPNIIMFQPWLGPYVFSVFFRVTL